MQLRGLALAMTILSASDGATADGALRIAAGVSSGHPPLVAVRDGETTGPTFEAYGASFSGGVRVAVGDLNGDGTPDIVTAPGPGTGPRVRVFDGAESAPTEIWGFYPFTIDHMGGIFVAAGDVNGDGTTDVITGSGSTGGGHVKVFDGVTHESIRDFLAFDPTFTGGVRVAAGDVDGDGFDDIVVGSGVGAAHVKVFRGTDLDPIRSFLPYGTVFTGGIFVAAGDMDGDGLAEQIVGPDEGVPPHVKAFGGETGGEIASFFAFDTFFAGGVRVAAGDVDGDGLADYVLGAGPGGAPTVRRLRGTDQQSLGDLLPFTPSFTGGVFVGAVPEPGATFGGIAALLALALRRSRD